MAKDLYTPPTGGSNYESPIAPAPSYPERVPTYYEGKMAASMPGQQGPARFYEGIVSSDRDIPNEFSNGAMQGYATAPGRSNHNMNVYEKWPAETMAERAHPGSASWPESPIYTGEFADGADTVAAERKYQMVARSGGHYMRQNAAEVND